MIFEFEKKGAELSAGTHRGDANAGRLPVEEFTDFVHGFFLEVEEADDH